MGPIQIGLVSLLKGGSLDTDVHAGRMPGEDKGTGQGDASPGQGMSSKPLESSRGAWNRFSFTTLRRDQAMPTS